MESYWDIGVSLHFVLSWKEVLSTKETRNKISVHGQCNHLETDIWCKDNQIGKLFVDLARRDHFMIKSSTNSVTCNHKVSYLCVNKWNINPTIANKHSIHVRHTVHLDKDFEYNIPACVFAIFLQTTSLISTWANQSFWIRPSLRAFLKRFCNRYVSVITDLVNSMCQQFFQTCAHMLGYQLIWCL